MPFCQLSITGRLILGVLAIAYGLFWYMLHNDEQVVLVAVENELPVGRQTQNH